MNFARNMLQMYDACKTQRTPEECRGIVAASVPRMADLYLQGYDACLKGFSPETCRDWMSPPDKYDTSRTPIIALGVGAVLGFLFGRML
jgi:hypothetical protein